MCVPISAVRVRTVYPSVVIAIQFLKTAAYNLEQFISAQVPYGLYVCGYMVMISMKSAEIKSEKGHYTVGSRNMCKLNKYSELWKTVVVNMSSSYQQLRSSQPANCPDALDIPPNLACALIEYQLLSFYFNTICSKSLEDP
jgi:hypothetical protein